MEAGDAIRKEVLKLIGRPLDYVLSLVGVVFKGADRDQVFIRRRCGWIQRRTIGLSYVRHSGLNAAL